MDEGTKKKKTSKIDARLIGNIAPYAGLVLVIIVFAFLTNGKLLSTDSLQSMSSSVLTTAICTIGAVFIFSAGYFDMSLGGSLCMSAVLGTMVTISTGNLLLGGLVILGVSVAIGVIKSVLATHVNVPFFIFTIILGSIFGALTLAMMGSATRLGLADAVKPIPEFTFTQMSMISVAVLVVFFLICLFLFNYTPLGLEAKNMGGNIFATKQSGISTKKITYIVFLIGSIGVAIAAFLIMIRTRTVTSGTGGSLGNNVMVALVLGGMPLSGGPRSKISAGLVGAVTITVLNTGLTMMGLDTGQIQIIRGIIFIVVVLVSSLSYRTRLLPR